jgi:hypothetical protein
VVDVDPVTRLTRPSRVEDGRMLSPPSNLCGRGCRSSQGWFPRPQDGVTNVGGLQTPGRAGAWIRCRSLRAITSGTHGCRVLTMAAT